LVKQRPAVLKRLSRAAHRDLAYALLAMVLDSWKGLIRLEGLFFLDDSGRACAGDGSLRDNSGQEAGA